MNWLGLSPASLLVGLGAAGTSLFVLHLLKVRPRRVKIETLLFARAAAPTPKPVALFGRPARWWAFLLGALILALAVAGAGDPLVVSEGPSRLVLDAGNREAADAFADAGLGPRGGRLVVPGALGARARDLVAATSRPGDPDSPLLAPPTTTVAKDDVGAPFSVTVAGELPEAIARLAASESSADASAPRLTLAVRGAAVTGPALLLDPGVDARERRAVATPDCPLPLSLRDRRGKNATALATLPSGAVAWVIDAFSGAPLVASWIENDAARVACVDWLLAPLGHRDVPILVAGSLRLLAGADVPAAATVAVPWAFPALPGAAVVCDGPDAFRSTTHEGRVVGTFTRPGTHTLEGWFGRRTLTVADAPAPPPTSPPARVPNPWRGGFAVLVAAVAFIALETWWHHRGRTP